MVFLFRKIKSILLFLLRIVRRAFCCFRLRSKQDSLDDEDNSLTHVGVVPNRSDDTVDWNNDWQNQEDGGPRSVQDHIKAYRERKIKSPVDQQQEEQLDSLFQELTPRVVPAPKILLKNKEKSTAAMEPAPDLSRLAPANNYSADLGEWVEEAAIGSGWDEQNMDPSDLIRQNKRRVEVAA